LRLGRSLHLALSLSDAVDVAKEATQKFPTDKDLGDTLERVTKDLEKMKEAGARNYKGCASELRPEGKLHRKAYPWMTGDLLQRSDGIIQEIKEDYTELPHCTVAPNPFLTKLHSETSTNSYGVVATSNIPQKDNIIAGGTHLFASAALGTCPTCNSLLPPN
jgi:hypothetical protein